MGINLQTLVTSAFKTADNLVTGIRKSVTLTGYTGDPAAPADYTNGVRNDLTPFSIATTGIWTDYDRDQPERGIRAGDAQLIIDAADVSAPRGSIDAVTRGSAEWEIIKSSGEYTYTLHLRRIGEGVTGG